MFRDHVEVVFNMVFSISDKNAAYRKVSKLTLEEKYTIIYKKNNKWYYMYIKEWKEEEKWGLGIG